MQITEKKILSSARTTLAAKCITYYDGNFASLEIATLGTYHKKSKNSLRWSRTNKPNIRPTLKTVTSA